MVEDGTKIYCKSCMEMCQIFLRNAHYDSDIALHNRDYRPCIICAASEVLNEREEYHVKENPLLALLSPTCII